MQRCAERFAESPIRGHEMAQSTALAPPNLPEASVESLHAARERARAEYAALAARKLSLNMTRGKPSTEQVALADRLLTAVTRAEDCIAEDGSDCRNYFGDPQGLIEARRLYAPVLGAPPQQVLVANNSSLSLMHDQVVFALLTGVRDGALPWSRYSEPVIFLCPAPGYDRHFAICERYGIRMVPVPLTGHGPDMVTVERLVADPLVKGMWCVPMYSNPTGETYSSETVARLARMKTAADDFRLFWDNAYGLHHLTEVPDRLDSIIAACAAAGHPDRPLAFASSSKVSYAQAGLGFFASSPANMAWYVNRAGTQAIGPDKLNQLRHARVFGDAAGIERHMHAHRRILEPKFATVYAVLSERLGGIGIARWTTPRGGYFVSLDVLDGCATRVVELAAQCGLAMVPAGRTFPHGRDPRDSNIRLAPSFPPVEEVRLACEVIVACTVLAASEKLLRDRGVNL
jgi:aspartate/methionine/tyrosine aminotransferase